MKTNIIGLGDWSLITGRGGGQIGRGRGHVKFYAYEKGGGGAQKVLAMLKEGGGAKSFHLLKGEGGRKKFYRVLRGGGPKSFSHFVAPPPLPVTNDQSLTNLHFWQTAIRH